MEDDLRPEYDLSTLQVRRFGPKRTSFGGVTVRLDPDVAEMFPTADAVKEARAISFSREPKDARVSG